MFSVFCLFGSYKNKQKNKELLLEKLKHPHHEGSRQRELSLEFTCIWSKKKTPGDVLFPEMPPPPLQKLSSRSCRFRLCSRLNQWRLTQISSARGGGALSGFSGVCPCLLAVRDPRKRDVRRRPFSFNFLPNASSIVSLFHGILDHGNI